MCQLSWFHMACPNVGYKQRRGDCGSLADAREYSFDIVTQDAIHPGSWPAPGTEEPKCRPDCPEAKKVPLRFDQEWIVGGIPDRIGHVDEKPDPEQLDHASDRADAHQLADAWVVYRVKGIGSER
jgi:hypothetical protein